MRVSRRTEYVLGHAVPLTALVGLLVLGMSLDQAAAFVAFMAAVPMFAAMFTGAALTGIVAAATLVAALVASASASGRDFYDAVPIVIGVIVGSTAAGIASQMKAAAVRRPAPAAHTGAAASRPSPVVEPGTDELTGLPTRIAVAGPTRWALPEEDTVARWHGGPFLLVIHRDPVSVRPTLELITDRVNANPIRCDAGLVPATVSLGAAKWSGDTDFADAVGRARRALSSAKAQGPGHLVLDAWVKGPRAARAGRGPFPWGE